MYASRRRRFPVPIIALAVLAATSFAAGQRSVAAARPAAVPAVAPLTGTLSPSAGAVDTSEAGPAAPTPASTVVPDPAASLVAVEAFAATTAQQGGDVRLGTGFVVRTGPSGVWVATAAHVANMADAAVYLPGEGVPHVVNRIAVDPNADLALLHVPFLPGAAAVQLGPAPTSAWAAEVSCVRWPNWTFQAYPIPLGPGALGTPGADYALLTTPSLSVLPGCSGGPLDVYGAAGDGASVVVGSVVSGTIDPPGVGFVPAPAIQSMLDSVTGH